MGIFDEFQLTNLEQSGKVKERALSVINLIGEVSGSGGFRGREGGLFMRSLAGILKRVFDVLGFSFVSIVEFILRNLFRNLVIFAVVLIIFV